ncbi:hypothetical protein B0H11DRAFT_1114497 [Mycena galericulata]|nr:hypothetical protein B0H11DRAFT_1114497 [Mycena galericulata]
MYVWAARSLSETMQDILESVCYKMGLDPADYILVIPGDNAPLEGTVSDLHGNRELAMVERKPTGVGKVSTSTQSHLEVVYLRINLESLPNATHCSTTVAVTPLMQIQDVLNLVCWRTKAPAPGYTLGLAGGVQPLAMDRTVASLQGDRNLILIESAPRLINEASERVNLGASEHINLRISSDGGGLTNVSAAPQMQIQEVLELICWRRTIKASEYTLALAGSEQSLSLDCDVTSLEGKRDLVLVKRPCIPPTATSPSLQLRMFTDDRKFTDDSVAPEMHNVPAANGTVADLEGNRDLVLVNRARPLPRSVLLRINLRISPDEPHLTDISVSPTIQIENVLKHVCWMLKFQTTEYTLALTGGVEPLPMARTVADLGESHELVLVKRRD